jgi:hypothetical protein
MGFSQLDRPIFDKYKLVREEDVQTEKVTEIAPNEQIKSELDKLWNEIDVLKEQAKQAADFIKRSEDYGA